MAVESLVVLGEKVVCHSVAEDYFMFSVTVNPGSGPPLHAHDDVDEIFYCMSGKFKMQLGEKVRDVVPGDCVTVKRGVPHTYLSTGEEQGTFMSVIFNGSLYNMFKECDKVSDHGAKSLTVEQMGAIAGANKVKIVGPPLST